MQTACNTSASLRTPLPSPDDPSLNEPTIRFRPPDALPSMDDPSLNEPTQCIPNIEDLSNPDAIALMAFGPEYYSRIQRIEDCGEYGSIQHCDNGHPLCTRIHRCQGNFTECCRDEHAKKTLKRLNQVIEFFTEYRGSRYTAIELAIPIPRDRSIIESTLLKIREDLREFQLSTFHQRLLEPNWIMCLGFMGGSLIVRVLIVDLDSKGSSTISTDAWRRLWTGWKVSVSVNKNPTFRSAFNSLLKALPLKDSADRMAQEVLFNDMQRFRGSRFKLSVMNAANTKVEKEIANTADLCVDTPTHDSSPEANSNQPQAKSAPPCPICGHACDRFSGMMRVRGREMMEYLAKMRSYAASHAPPG